jgi:hypothetical protein
MAVIYPSKLTPAQVRAIQAAGRLAPEAAEGIANTIIAQLGGAGPWRDSAVQTAISTVLTTQGIDSPIISTT